MASSNANPHLSAKRRSNSSPELQIHGMDCTEIPDLPVLKAAVAGSKKDEAGPNSSSATSINNDPVPQICLEHLQAVPHSDGYIGPELKDKTVGNDKCTNKDLNQASVSSQVISVEEEKENECPKTENMKSQVRRRQSGITRVASAIVSKFYSRERPKKPERQSSKELDDSRSDGANSPGLQRGRSKSLSGRILRRFRDASRDRNCDDSQNSTPKRRQSHRDTTKSGTDKTRQVQKKRYTPLLNFAEFDPQLYPTECEEDIQRAIREKEIQEGVDPPPGYQPQTQYFDNDGNSSDSSDSCLCPSNFDNSRTSSPQAAATISIPKDPSVAPYPHLSKVIPEDLREDLKPTSRPHAATAGPSSSKSEATYMTPQAHTQVDYMHCLVPDQQGIMNSCFYWGKIDRYEADEILEKKPEGTFLLRDSSQEEFLFSVSFRRYGRTLHARIEQWNHKFSFDAHDPSVYSCDTICGLLEHYKDPNYCMFFEPMLTIPLPRTNPPTLQELARSVICSKTTYDGVHYLELPRVLKDYLKEYHYKQRVRVRQINNHPEAEEKAPSPKFVYKNVSKTCISR